MSPQKLNQRNCVNRFWSGSVTVGWFQSSAIVVLLVLLCSSPDYSIFVSAQSSTTDTAYAPYTKCFRSVCDLRVQYCDADTKDCGECDIDCHPSRIQGDPGADQECKEKCQWYYVFTSTTPPTMMTPNCHNQSSLLVQEGLQSKFTWDLAMEIGQLLLLAFIAVAIVVVICQICSGKRSRGGLIATDVSRHGRPVDDDKLVVVSCCKNGASLECKWSNASTSPSLPVECSAAPNQMKRAVSDPCQVDKISLTEPLLKETCTSTSS